MRPREADIIKRKIKCFIKKVQNGFCSCVDLAVLEVVNMELKQRRRRRQRERPKSNRIRPCLHGVGTPVQWGKFLLFCVPQSVKTKETHPTRPGSPTPCKQALIFGKTTTLHVHHAFLYISRPSLHDNNLKVPNFKVCRGREL